MKLLGLKRVKEVYPVWTVIYAIFLGIMIYYKIKITELLFIILFLFLMKTLLLDYKIVKVKRRRVYWAEHGPFNFLIILLGILGILGFNLFEGYVDYPTIVIAFVGFILDFVKDLREDTKAYGK